MWNNWFNTTLKLTRVSITGELWLVVTTHCFMQSQFSFTVPRTFQARTGLVLELLSLCTLVTRNLTTKSNQRAILPLKFPKVVLLNMRINVKLKLVWIFIFKNEISFTVDKSIEKKDLYCLNKYFRHSKKHETFKSIFTRIAWLTYSYFVTI